MTCPNLRSEILDWSNSTLAVPLLCVSPRCSPVAPLVVPGPVVTSTRSRRLSDSDWLLLETLDTSCQRPLQTGRFLTMHKRRRKRLTTRSLSQEPALLDDIQHGQVQCVLERVCQWPFNAFTLDTVTGGRSLPVLCVHLFHWYGLMDHFNLDVVRVWKLFSLIEEGYHSTNPYHNSIHATDVTQAMHCFLQEEQIRTHLTPLEIMSSLIAAVTHDLDHPGNTSVLENHHWRSAIGCLLESNIAEQLGESRQVLEQQISSLILATDITRQQEFLTKFKRYLDQKMLDMRRAEDRHFILQIALKCADISNPCRPWDVSRKWSQKVCEEFFRQGDYERQLNLPVTSLCDRHSTSIPKIQAGFLRFVVTPLVEEWHRFLGTDLSTRMMGHLRVNKEKWEALVQQELDQETKTEMNDVDSGHRVGRRHSVPLSLPKPPPISRTIIRRESLPVGEHRPQRRLPSSPIQHLEEEEDIQLGQSSLSLISSCSSEIHPSSGCSGQDKRPVSAENLLPEPSIASITTSQEASRLSTVLHGGSNGGTGVSRHLTRQQTFPPLQPYIRARYMSTTAEMNRSEALAETDRSSDSSSSSHSVSRVVALKDSNRTSCSSGTKRDSSRADTSRIKMAKWAESEECSREKENVDPRRIGSDLDLEQNKTGLARRNIPQVLARRRGSAPVGLLNRSEDGVGPNALALRGGGDRFSRRGSVPIDVTRQSVLKPLGLKENASMPRRSSLPYDLARHSNTTLTSLFDPLTAPTGEGGQSESSTDPLSSILARQTQLYRGTGAADMGSGKTRGRKVLRRRSSGGPELFEPGREGVSWHHWRREVLARRTDAQLLGRRGSLPIEVLALTHSGTSHDRLAHTTRRVLHRVFAHLSLDNHKTDLPIPLEEYYIGYLPT
uniref:(California timema) hypothetical protein n=1 Tax=Timema californicum TaxID=61474 RepID=A0A7R9P7Z7_TIMCA|nr:unnamed protein product [Timema californicum]